MLHALPNLMLLNVDHAIPAKQVGITLGNIINVYDSIQGALWDMHT